MRLCERPTCEYQVYHAQNTRVFTLPTQLGSFVRHYHTLSGSSVSFIRRLISEPSHSLPGRLESLVRRPAPYPRYPYAAKAPLQMFHRPVELSRGRARKTHGEHCHATATIRKPAHKSTTRRLDRHKKQARAQTRTRDTKTSTALFYGDSHKESLPLSSYPPTCFSSFTNIWALLLRHALCSATAAVYSLCRTFCRDLEVQAGPRGETSISQQSIARRHYSQARSCAEQGIGSKATVPGNESFQALLEQTATYYKGGTWLDPESTNHNACATQKTGKNLENLRPDASRFHLTLARHDDEGQNTCWDSVRGL